MIDIIGADSLGLHLYDTQSYKAKNILSVQLGSLEYLQEFGIDLRYFLSENFQFQNESFKAYCVEILANNGINVNDVIEVIEALDSRFLFNISPEENSTGLVAR